MSFRRLAETFASIPPHVRRPLFIFLAVILLLSAWGFRAGRCRFLGEQLGRRDESLDHLEFAQTQMMTFIILLYYAFFIAASAGLTLHGTGRRRWTVLLHSNAAQRARGSMCGDASSRGRRFRDF